MALLTTEQVNSSTIKIAQKFSEDDVHKYWLFSAEDSDGENYTWKDKKLSSSATDSEQKTVINNFLLTCEKKTALPIISKTNSDNIIGTTVG